MPTPDVLYPEPIIIRYEGIDAARHQIDLALLGTSLQGAARLIGVAAHISLTGVYVSRSPALTVRVLAGQPRSGCYEIPVYLLGLGTIPVLPLLSEAGRAAGKRAVEAIVNFILSKLGGNESVAIMAMETAQQAIAANHDVSLKALELAAALVKAGEDQRPAARLYAAPIGQSATSTTIGEPERAFLVDKRAKDQLEQRADVKIGPAQSFTVLLSELDLVSGSCKVAIQGDESSIRYDCEIADPVVGIPHNPYSTALDSQAWITVTAKPHIRSGEITKLTISDTVN